MISTEPNSNYDKNGRLQISSECRLQISKCKKSFVEVCKWSCRLEDIVENLDADDEDHQLLKENLKLEADDQMVRDDRRSRMEMGLWLCCYD